MSNLFTQNVFDIERLLRLTAHKFGYTFSKQIPPDPKALSFQDFVRFYIALHGPTTCVIVGGNDGVTNDPLYPLIAEGNLHGIAVEPQKDAFALLQENYAKYPGIMCANIAISTKRETKILYTVKESYKTTDNWKRVSGLASFNRDVIIKTIKRKIPKGANPEDYIDEHPVPCDTLAGLLKSCNIPRVDIYQIDCEGYDFEIVKQIDFTNKKPSLINYESHHLAPHEQRACIELLEGHGYAWFNHALDTCAYLTRNA